MCKKLRVSAGSYGIWFVMSLVREPENKYDPHAVLVRTPALEDVPNEKWDVELRGHGPTKQSNRWQAKI